MLERLTRAARMDPFFYQELNRDPGLDREATMVVGLIGVVNGVGALVAGVMKGDLGLGLAAAIIRVVIVFAVWMLAVWIIHTVGRSSGGVQGMAPMRRSLAYAMGPLVLGGLLFLGPVGAVVCLVGTVWSAVLTVLAVREVTRLSVGQAVRATLSGYAGVAVAVIVLSLVLGALRLSWVLS